MGWRERGEPTGPAGESRTLYRSWDERVYVGVGVEEKIESKKKDIKKK